MESSSPKIKWALEWCEKAIGTSAEEFAFNELKTAMKDAHVGKVGEKRQAEDDNENKKVAKLENGVVKRKGMTHGELLERLPDVGADHKEVKLILENNLDLRALFFETKIAPTNIHKLGHLGWSPVKGWLEGKNPAEETKRKIEVMCARMLVIVFGTFDTCKNLSIK